MYERLGLLSIDTRGEYGYLIYPQRPIVGYDAQTASCSPSTACASATAPTPRRGRGSPMPTTCSPSGWRSAWTSELIGTANVHPLGRQLDPAMVRRDLSALRAWQR